MCIKDLKKKTVKIHRRMDDLSMSLNIKTH